MSSNKFNLLREKYDTFIYDKYEITYDSDSMNIKYYFNIPKLTWFYPQIKIKKKDILNKEISSEFLNILVFQIGLIELISYLKCTCSPNVIIKAGYLDKKQIKWFKKLYYNGLSEFFYKNNINISLENLMNIACTSEKKQIPSIKYNGQGNLIAIGGGKDSCVSLEILKNEKNNSCFIINAKEPSLECALLAGYSKEKIVCIERILDKQIIELNNKGFLNGHTPLNSLIAFLSYLVCYLQNKQKIILSNESSANEATIIGTNINHQYSKSFEFEKDFSNYIDTYLKINIKYLSLLRGLNEIQIAKIFSHYEKYHSIFKSCNLGSKNNKWEWCCNCPKCLFVFIILSPFLSEDKLITIFKENLYERSDLLKTFKQILGYEETKPFECVGTYEEARYAVSLLISKLPKENLPYLLKYYFDNYNLELNDSLLTKYNTANNLNEHFETLVKEELKNA